MKALTFIPSTCHRESPSAFRRKRHPCPDDPIAPSSERRRSLMCRAARPVSIRFPSTSPSCARARCAAAQGVQWLSCSPVQLVKPRTKGDLLIASGRYVRPARVWHAHVFVPSTGREYSLGQLADVNGFDASRHHRTCQRATSSPCKGSNRARAAFTGCTSLAGPSEIICFSHSPVHERAGHAGRPFFRSNAPATLSFRHPGS